MTTTPWWQNAVIYQVYPRSFQDSDGDGIGDVRGITARLGHLSDLGVDAVWLSPIYPSPLADGGYDIADFTGVDPRLGTIADVAELAAATRRRGMALLLDIVPNHTSIEHPWFRAHPDWYVWADAPANNWRAAFGGPAWTRDERTGRFYLHSFYPEQPDLDWRNPAVAAAMQDVLRFWRRHGADGFRLDALDRVGKDPELRDDPPAREPFPFPQEPAVAALDRSHSSNYEPALHVALGALRSAAGDGFLVGEVYRRTTELGPYLEHLDSAFMFELLFADWRADVLGDVIERGARVGRVSWMLSNHDFSRVGSRIGERNVRAAAMLLLTLPGTAFLYQGDEIGMLDGPGGNPPVDRFGRDAQRHPMQWDASPSGGFTTGTGWLPSVDPAARNVADERRDRHSLLALHRALIALRRTLTGKLELVAAEPDGLLAYHRGEHAVVLNLGETARPSGIAGDVVLATDHNADPGLLAPGAGAVIRRR
jgi:alpha-glucosidase